MVRKLLTWGGLAFVLFLIASNPGVAGSIFQSIGEGIMDVAQGLGELFTSPVG